MYISSAAAWLLKKTGFLTASEAPQAGMRAAMRTLWVRSISNRIPSISCDSLLTALATILTICHQNAFMLEQLAFLAEPSLAVSMYLSSPATMNGPELLLVLSRAQQALQEGKPALWLESSIFQQLLTSSVAKLFLVIRGVEYGSCQG